MTDDTSADVKPTEKAKADKNASTNKKKMTPDDSYVLPVFGVRVESKFVNAGFWGGLVGAAALGIVDPPLALFLGAGVVIARHQNKK